jgi:hypothetical protein
MIQVDGHKNLFRDEQSGAIVNTDTLGHAQYIKMRSEKKRQKEEIDQIKEDINEIKTLLREIINGKNGS